VIDSEPINQQLPPESLPTDPPKTSQVPEQSTAVSEGDTGGQDITQSIITPENSHDRDYEGSDASVVEITHEDHHESGEVLMPTEESQSGHPASADVESLQERLKLMEQRFAGQ
jgi:hypothetical protein